MRPVSRREPGPPPTRSPSPIARCCKLFLPVVTSRSGAPACGLGSADLVMNVVLPEIDCRIRARAVSFKAPLGRDPDTEIDLAGYRPVADRVRFVADLARNWARLRHKPPSERRIALILANYPNRDGRIGNGVGLD